ncbi:MAG: hypothetical protein E7534_03385 [Ruminococcaceae bacterium]|nr:hypothetical protein [Oscillospiraceae bacterium]
MKENIIRKLVGVLVIVGFVIILGAVGASDCGTIGIAEMLARGVFGLALMGAGAWIGVAKKI